MTKKILKILIYISFFICLIMAYLSYFGIETKKFNSLIKETIYKTNNNIDVKIKKVKIVLNLSSLSVGVETKNPTLIFKNKKIKLNKISSNFSIKSFLYKEFAIKNLSIFTDENNINNIISFLRLYKNTPQLFIFDKVVKKGTIKSVIKLNFDDEGNIIDDYNIQGSIKNVKLSLINKQIINNINLIFDITHNQFLLKNSDIEFNKVKLSSKKIRIYQKKDKKFHVEGDFKSNKGLISKEILSILFKKNFNYKNFSNLNLETNNNFKFKLNKKYKFSDVELKSDIDLASVIYKKETDLEIKKYIPHFKNKIELVDHKIKLKLKDKDLSIEGEGKFLIENKNDDISYNINISKDNFNFRTKLKINNNALKIDILNYKKKKEKASTLFINGKYKKNKYIDFKNISFEDSENKFSINNLNLNNNFKINYVDQVNFNFVNENNIVNKITLKKNKNNYKLYGVNFDFSVLLNKMLENNSKRGGIDSYLNNLTSYLEIDIDKAYIDKNYYLSNFNGGFNIIKNEIITLDLDGKFDRGKKLTFKIRTNKTNEKITTVFSDYAKPLVKRYGFIKGFEDGILDFYSVKKNNISKSQLKIYEFKLKEVPVLTKILTLASLQGIADLLTGEGIRFNEFEMNFNNEGALMTIDEIYAIGPAISILMSGYIESEKIVSLRGTLVPATTLNKVIGSLPLIGNILVGKKTGEGVFGVSFKIKGPPKNLKTTVNPIKTLTPRFITRTLEKVKK